MTEEETLECGRPVESVWETLDGQPDAHQRECPSCTEARSRLKQLHELTRESRREDEQLEAAPETRRRIMDFARAHARRGSDIPVLREEHSTISFSQMVISRSVREAADQVEGITARRCRIRVPEETPEGLQDLRLDLSLVITPSVRITETMPRVRERITAAVSERLGARISEINLSVEDVRHD